MKTIYSPVHLGHRAQGEFNRGALVPPFEKPERAEWVREAVERAAFGPLLEPREFGLEPVLRVHDAGYVAFLRGAYEEWRALGRSGDVIPMSWPGRGMRADRVPRSLDGRLGHYSYDIGTPITAGTWEAVRTAADVALTATALVEAGERTAFALCRPPGHHAARDYFGGYCYLNNAAIAAQYLRDRGAARVAIFDVDYHHGNGTQSIFYDRPDVLFVSIHGDPDTEYPYFLGHADERGSGAGEGFNLNLPLPMGSGDATYLLAFDEIVAPRVRAFAPELLIIANGLDAGQFDPNGRNLVTCAGFHALASRARALAAEACGGRLLIVQEGGYNPAHAAFCLHAAIEGFISLPQSLPDPLSFLPRFEDRSRADVDRLHASLAS